VAVTPSHILCSNMYAHNYTDISLSQPGTSSRYFKI